MIGLVIGQIVALATIWLAFIAIHVTTPGWWRSPVGRQLAAMAVVSFGEAASLVALGAGLSVPMWVLAVGYGAMDVVMARWLWLQWRARQEGKRDVD